MKSRLGAAGARWAAPAVIAAELYTQNKALLKFARTGFSQGNRRVVIVFAQRLTGSESTKASAAQTGRHILPRVYHGRLCFTTCNLH
jgi:hypothetical protein